MTTAMATLDRLLAVRRTMRKAGFEMHEIPPFAIPEPEMADLLGNSDFSRQNLLGHVNGVYQYRGIRIMKGYSNG